MGQSQDFFCFLCTTCYNTYQFDFGGDDSYFGGSKPGKRGRGAGGKGKEVVAVEDREYRVDFMEMAIVKRLTGKEILRQVGDSIDEQSAVKTDGWSSYIRLLNACLNTTTITFAELKQ